MLNNKVQLAGFALPSGDTEVKAITQKGVLGTVTFKAQAPGIAKIEFDNDSSVVASSAEDVLKSTTGAFITVR